MMKSKKKRISIRNKIWLAIMSTVFVIIGGLWLLQVVFLEDYYLKIKKNDIVNNTQAIVKAINYKGLYNAGDDIYRIGSANTLCIDISQPTGEPIVGYEGLGENCVLHANGLNKLKVLKEANANKGTTVLADITHPKYDTRFYSCAITMDAKDGNQYTVMVTATLAPVKEAAVIIKNQLIWVSILLVLVATAIAFILARSLTKPIQKLSKAAREIAYGNWNADCTVPSNDELGDLSQNFSYMQKEFAKVNILQKELVANISHDIRTPLTMIKGYAEAIKDITGDNKEMREHQLDIIVDETNRLNTLVNDVMDLSLMQAGQTPMNIEPFNIAKTITDILGRFELLEQTKGFEFTYIGNEIAMANGDEVRIEQVLYNLINNAVNHIGEQKQIKVSVIEQEKVYRVEVSDTGTGIAQEDLPLIWDRYYKPYKNGERKTVGTGLGLSIVKAILVNHGSQFGVYSTIGVGSTFWFTLTKAKPEENQ
ncbi:HAMP domain-containing sensor histidine kinase [Paludicola sp. MB14-C6]|uniref:sensor histidine kinase n=1 Tax=Paludihabitans sp. MB14-C6 TaxID=3070656 RepID=UPI0027DDC456|nr:HAMP domain-containing sensor histidine kinase [Paludicola sp. MB14-C6]WMJ22296.1 HAMP domain-containing sensor histidine kinase [Paludicola sp. MB14-C6]